MAYILGGIPQKVENYPKATKTWPMGNRSKETKIDYDTGVKIIQRYKLKAEYWENKVPFISLKYAMEARDVLKTVYETYSANDGERGELNKLGRALIDISLKQANLALETPTQEVLEFVQNRKERIYKTITNRELNEKGVQLHEIEQLLKSDYWAKMISDVNSKSFSFFYTLHKGAYEVKDKIDFNKVMNQNLLVEKDTDLKPDANKSAPDRIKNTVGEISKIIDEFVKKQYSYVGYTEGYQQRWQKVKEDNRENLAVVGKIVETVKQEYAAFLEGVLDNAKLGAQMVIDLKGIGDEISKLAGKYPKDGILP
ncbi:MAG: hypothetical protein NTX79_06910 [Candidatus Micrarchaeota archaeon]|nr:hypothetical protein [Candidatus Micrarchaeota archaeon]